MVRCRLRTAWALFATAVMLAMLCVELVIIGAVWHLVWQIWFLLITVLTFGWFVDRNRHDLQRLISVVLDDIAAKNGLIKLNREQKPAKKP